MTSTRLNNDNGEYCKQQRGSRLAEQFTLYKYKCISKESALFGIGSTNLVNTKAPVVAKIYKLPDKKFFTRHKSFLPEPLVVEKFQRPIGPFC